MPTDQTDQQHPTTGAEAYARQLLIEAREEVARADGKAAVLFSGASLVVSVTAAVLVSEDWFPFELDNRIEWVWWIGAACVVTAIALLAAAVYPRVKRNGGSQVMFFGDVAAYASVTELADALTTSSDSWPRTVDQLWHLSRIADRKYLLTRWALKLAGAGAALLAISAVCDLILS